MTTQTDIATFYFIQLVDGKFTKTIESGIVINKFNGGIQVKSSKFPNGKCIAVENIIELN